MRHRIEPGIHLEGKQSDFPKPQKNQVRYIRKLQAELLHPSRALAGLLLASPQPVTMGVVNSNSKLQRRLWLLGSFGSLVSAAPPALARPTNDVSSISQILPPEVNKFSNGIGELDKAPMISTSFASPNSELRYRSLGSFFGGSFLGRGERKARYLVLCFFPSSETQENEIEAGSFQARETSFCDLDSLVVVCSSQTDDELRENLIDKKALTLPFLSDPDKELITAFGADGIQDTCRATFIIDTSGTIRWVERNVNLDRRNGVFGDYAEHVEQELTRILVSDSRPVEATLS